SAAELRSPGSISDTSVAGRQRVFARVLITISVLAGLLIAANLAVLLWGDNEFSLPESVVGAQSMMLAHEGTFYNSLRDYPYTVNAYMPNFYLLEAGLIRIGVPAFKAGRMISFAALLGIFVLCWRLLVLYTGDRFCAWTGTLMCACTSVVLSWGTAGQVDTLTVFFALTAFYHYSRYRLEPRSGKCSALTLAGLFVV